MKSRCPWALLRFSQYSLGNLVLKGLPIRLWPWLRSKATYRE
jgi:hypothetical protein